MIHQPQSLPALPAPLAHGGQGPHPCSRAHGETGCHPLPTDDIRAAINPMLDAPELAEVLNVSVRTVWRWVRAGRIRAVKIGPQATRFTYEEVERVVHGRTQAVRALLDQHRPEPSTRRPT